MIIEALNVRKYLDIYINIIHIYVFMKIADNTTAVITQSQNYLTSADNCSLSKIVHT